MSGLRAFGLLLVLGGLSFMWYLGYQGLTFDQARQHLAALFGVPFTPKVLPGGLNADTNASQASAGTLRPGQPS